MSLESASRPVRKPIAFIDLASVVSAVAVVYLHTNDAFWHYSPEVAHTWWPSANIIECLFYFAVPVFFMISGATLLDFNERYGLGTYFKKRCSKTLVPYVVWSLLGLGFQVFVTKSVAPDTVTAGNILRGLLNGNLVAVYWFFIPLFCLYLSIPLFAEVPKERRKRVFTYLAVVSFAFNFLAPFVANLIGHNLSATITVGVGAGYLFYIFTGYLICHYDMPRRWRVVVYILAICGLVMHIVGTQIFSDRMGAIDQTFKGYTNVPCILWSIGVFVFLKYAGGALMRRAAVARVVGRAKRYTFAVYLLHIYIVWSIPMVTGVSTFSLAYRALAPIAIFLVAAGLAWALRKIPGVRRWVLP